MSARARAAVTACVAALGVAACTTSEAGTAIPGSTEPPSNTSEPNSYGAPHVEHPLNAAAFVADPCAVLAPDQLSIFTVSPGEKDPAAAICNWHSDADSSSIGVSWLDRNKNGLADLYRYRDREAYFEETSVEGYPAVFSDTGDYRDDGDCVITVGVSDTLTFFAGESGLLDGDAACARARQVAAAVIVTVKGAQ